VQAYCWLLLPSCHCCVAADALAIALKLHCTALLLLPLA
jgi:hypothetical protein